LEATVFRTFYQLFEGETLVPLIIDLYLKTPFSLTRTNVKTDVGCPAIETLPKKLVLTLGSLYLYFF
jgi:hypothetical protein